jgi:YesN/AraC family two-component response regulator
VLFFDIRMPGQTGLEAAAELADEWPEGSNFPALVFVTAYDQYAVQAFDAQAVDYVLKPVQAARLQKTVAKLQQALAQRSQSSPAGQPCWRPRWASCATCWGNRPDRTRTAESHPGQRGHGHPHGAGGRGDCTLRPPTNTCAC